MKKWMSLFLVLWGLLLLNGASFAESCPAAADDKTQIVMVFRQFSEGVVEKNLDLIRDCLDDKVIPDNGGEDDAVGRDVVIQAIRDEFDRGVSYKTVEFTDFEISIEGRVAAVTCSLHVVESSSSGGAAERNNKYRATLRKTPQGWKIAETEEL